MSSRLASFVSFAGLLLLIFIPACGDDAKVAPPTPVPAGCNALGGDDCVLPWPSASLDPPSPTVVIDLDTGERVPHFAEPDLEAYVDSEPTPSDVALIIRPLVRLTPGKRYAVAITKALKAADGSELPRTAAFQA